MSCKNHNSKVDFSKDFRKKTENVNKNRIFVGGCMKKIISLGIIFLSLELFLFAGDAAVFVDEGFSKDGSTYVFGQYGKTDKSFKAYSELYAVDVAKNDFIKTDVYKSAADASAVNESGLESFEKLEAKSFLNLKKYSLKKTTAENLMYLCEDDEKKGTDEIIFTDFASSTVDSPITWRIQLHPTVKGSGVNAKSSFYISVKKEDASGAVLNQYTAGTPSVVRSGVVDYKIEKIVRDDEKKGIVFVVSKTIEDKTGTCIRYMVETLKI